MVEQETPIQFRVESIMSKDVLSFRPDTPLPEVIAALSGSRHCGAVVCEGRNPIGILSERDVVRIFTASLNGDPVDAQVVANVMTSPAFSLHTSENWQSVLDLLRDRGFRRVPVVDDSGALVGIVTLNDLLDAHTRELEAQRDLLEEKVESRTLELQELNAKLLEQTFEDPLLGIGNRRAMDMILEEMHAIALRYGTPYSVVLADIDHFKAYNDHYGHPEADDVLREVAQAMQGALRDSDRLYRYGGEEFVAILPETLAEGSRTTADRLRMAVSSLKIAHERTQNGIVTVSCGVTTALRGEEIPESAVQVITCADEALYDAKRAGRNRVNTYRKPESPS